MLNFIFDSSQHICLSQRKNSARRNVRLELGFFLTLTLGNPGWQSSDNQLIYSPVVGVVAAAAAAVTTTIFTQEAPLTEVVFREVQKLNVCGNGYQLNLVIPFDTTENAI